MEANCLLFGGLISILVSLLKKVRIVKDNPKIVAALLAAVISGVQAYYSDHAEASSMVVTFITCLMSQFTTSVGAYEVAKHLKPKKNADYIRRVPVFLLICFLVFTQACDKDQLRKAATASDRMAQLIDTGIEVKRTLAREGMIDRDEELALTRALLDVNRATKEFNDRARTYKEFTPDARTELATLFLDVASAITQLNEQGTLHVKNPQAKQKLQTVLSGLTAAAQTIRLILEVRK